MSMFCYQCQEAARGIGCNVRGVCGKTDDVANLQDLLIYTLKGIAVANQLAKDAVKDRAEADIFIVDSLFATITNANFNKDYFLEKIKKGLSIRNRLKASVADKEYTYKNDNVMVWNAEKNEILEEKAKEVGFMAIHNEDIRSLKAMIIYGLKGMAAYYKHAFALGYKNNEILDFLQKALIVTLNENVSADELVGLVMETGKYGVEVMALLDKANTETYGNPKITRVNIGVKENPAILISGHDLRDLEELLEQTKGTGVDVYTHGEMLPAHYYPAFEKYDNFVGNYGNAWWKQDKEFASFNGPVLLTTNCLIPPKDTYKDRVYTTGVVGYSGLKHIEEKEGKKDFSEIIAHAKRCNSPEEMEKGEIIGGFAHNTVISLADKVIGAVKSGAIKRFFVMAGCDGRMKSRDYYTEFAQKLPSDTIILTAGCAKYRYNKLNLGDIGGIPRVLDAGQCNDSYSLAIIAFKLKEAFGLEDINQLPISYNIAWYEQKAVIVLLALLYLGVKNIHLGPTLPAFISPNIAKVLIENFGIAGIGTVNEDINLFLD